jgi:hypothetical protein
MSDESSFDVGPDEQRKLLERRLFLQSMGKWSGAAIAAAVFGSTLFAGPPAAQAAGWLMPIAFVAHLNPVRLGQRFKGCRAPLYSVIGENGGEIFLKCIGGHAGRDSLITKSRARLRSALHVMTSYRGNRRRSRRGTRHKNTDNQPPNGFDE